MKLIPYLRFAWAASIIISFIKQDSFDFAGADKIEGFIVFSTGLLSLSFSFYCIVIGIQEIRMEKMINARYFEIFGLFFELLVFLGGFYLVIELFTYWTKYWQIVLFIVWEIGVLVFLAIDLKRLRANQGTW